jgi:undecaprenyl-diphosphatase
VAGDLDLVEAVLLGLVQGLTEWLPVSSTGHLVLARELLGVEPTLFLDLLLHVGTLAVILVYYRDTVGEVLRALPGGVAPLTGAGAWRETWWADPRRRLALLVAAGSVPTVIVGVVFETQLVALFGSPLAVGIGLIATGVGLFLARFARERRPGLPTLGAALVIGLAQGSAIVPGVSRSGATIATALLLGVHRSEAVRFSFLLSVPAILGATLFQADGASLASVAASPLAYAAGVLVAVVVGYAALALLERLVERRAFSGFCWYCWGVGLAVILVAA